MIRFDFAGERAQRRPPHAAFQQWTFPDGRPWTSFHRDGDGYLLQFPGLADFEVSGDGTRVTGWAMPSVARATVQHLFTNQVQPLALSRQGKLVLHASAVVVGETALAFAGESGRGKSTLAASFATHGMKFLCDDGLQLEWDDDDHPLAVPSQPSLRLWEDSCEAVLPAGYALGPPLDYTTKLRIIADGSLPFCDEPSRLGALYFLDATPTASVQIRPLPAAEAVRELIRHSFLLDIAEQQMLATHFDAVSRMARLARQFRIGYPRDYRLLPAVREAIIRHAGELLPR
jgi:hypothetical protein